MDKLYSTSRSYQLNIFYSFNKSFQKLEKIIVYLLILTFSTTTFYAQDSRTGLVQGDLNRSSSCKIDLKVEKDRNTRSTPPDGTYYSMMISNNGSSADIFTLNSLNINSSCSNADKSSTVNNVNLTANFLDVKLNSIKEISLSPGQSIKFFVHITVPVGSSPNKWCCTQVTAESKTCSNYKANIVLHTLVIDSSDD